MKTMKFLSMIERNSVEFTIEYPENTNHSDNPHDYDNLGNYIGSLNEPQLAVGALMPPNERQIYNSGGKLTQSDRILYSFDHKIPEGSKIRYKGMVYQVHPRSIYEGFADFSVYECRAVTAFD